eukprot:TRINITY_DN1586_c0_g1_i41.p1 TRINITY_DN1586_c0_g1~~TRINITY_DN1586_c0_g1_i41.p1  ORF type:complete len:384 (+),score=58.62 TRINITY_DN1586_c0_g1_i41:142-1293(+)
MKTQFVLKRKIRERSNRYSLLNIEAIQVAKRSGDECDSRKNKRQDNRNPKVSLRYSNTHPFAPLSQRQNNLCLKPKPNTRKVIQSELGSNAEKDSILPHISKEKGAKRTLTSLYLSISMPRLKIQKLNLKEMQKNSIVLLDSTSYTTHRVLKKETIAIVYNMQEICKLIKFRGDDLVIIEKLLADLPSPDFLHNFLSNTKKREAKRANSEAQKVLALQKLCASDADTKRTIVKSVKKTLAEFERKYFHEEPRIAVPSLKSQLDFIMNGNTSQKPPVSYDNTLNAVLQCAFRESRVDAGFICMLCALYTRSLLQRKLKKLIETSNRHAKAHRIASKLVLGNNAEESYKSYLIQAQEKLFEILWSHNKRISENIRRYAEKLPKCT